MTATLHNGKGEDFQLFTVPLDGDRLESHFRDGVRDGFHYADTAGMMRRLTKEGSRNVRTIRRTVRTTE